VCDEAIFVRILQSMSYTVLVDDNFHYMDADERYTLGEFESVDAAIIACKEIVDDYLRSALEPGMTGGQLYLSYVLFGEDPYIAGTDPTTRFSAWNYAKQRSGELCQGPPNNEASSTGQSPAG
jgi:hypothetical protein